MSNVIYLDYGMIKSLSLGDPVFIYSGGVSDSMSPYDCLQSCMAQELHQVNSRVSDSWVNVIVYKVVGHKNYTRWILELVTHESIWLSTELYGKRSTHQKNEIDKRKTGFNPLHPFHMVIIMFLIALSFSLIVLIYYSEIWSELGDWNESGTVLSVWIWFL